MEILDKKSEVVASLLRSLDEIQEAIKEAFKNRTPHLNGENFLSNRDICQMLHISSRTLQDWRNTGVIPFIQIRGKILYRQSDVLKLVERNLII